VHLTLTSCADGAERSTIVRFACRQYACINTWRDSKALDCWHCVSVDRRHIMLAAIDVCPAQERCTCTKRRAQPSCCQRKPWAARCYVISTSFTNLCLNSGRYGWAYCGECMPVLKTEDTPPAATRSCIRKPRSFICYE
jgi:hypothetical protein